MTNYQFSINLIWIYIKSSWHAIRRQSAVVAPHNVVAGLAGKQAWLLSADEDQYASQPQSLALFEALPTDDKRHIRFAGGHLLPAGYTEALVDWF